MYVSCVLQALYNNYYLKNQQLPKITDDSKKGEQEEVTGSRKPGRKYPYYHELIDLEAEI
jgi:hypothetical protein